MRAVGYRLRAEVRTRWRAWLALGIFIGIGAGFVGAALAGAVRTDSSYDRLLRDANAFDVVAIGGFCDEPSACPVAAVTELPQVADSALVAVHGARLRTEAGESVQPGGDPEYTGPGEVSMISAPDGRFGTVINRYRVVEGRAPDPRSASEVVISRALADRLDLHPGDSLRAALSKPNSSRSVDCSPTSGCEAPTGDDAPTAKVTARFRIVGIEVAPFEIAPPSGEYFALVHATPAFYDRAVTQGLELSDGMALRLRGGAAGEADLEAELRDRPELGITLIFHQADQATAVRRSITPHAVALGAVGLAAAFVALVLFGSVLIRQVFIDATDNRVLGSLGLRARDLWLLSMARAGLVALLAVITSIGVAFALSPLMPIGTARDAEPDPGAHFNGLVLLGGARGGGRLASRRRVRGRGSRRRRRRRNLPRVQAPLPRSSSVCGWRPTRDEAAPRCRCGLGSSAWSRASSR